MLEFLHTTPFGRAIYLLIISMLPVIERGGIPMAAVMGMPWFEAFFIWFLGNNDSGSVHYFVHPAHPPVFQKNQIYGSFY